MKKIIFLFCILSFIFSLHYFVVRQAVYGDSLYYWSYAKTLYIDHDLNFSRTLNHRFNPIDNNLPEQLVKVNTITNQSAFHLPIGSALAWLPFFIIADVLIRLGSFLGFHVVNNGFSDMYQITVGLGNVLYICLGIVFIYKLLRLLYKEEVAITACITLVLATNLLYYGGIDVINSHPFSFFISSLFFYLWFVTHKKMYWYHFVLFGVLCGLLILTRTQEIIFLGFSGIIAYTQNFQKEGKAIVLKCLGFLRDISLVIVATVLILSPQIVIFYIIYHGFFNSPYVLHDNPFDFLHPHIFGVLTDYKTGLLFYSPVLLIGFFGLFFVKEKFVKFFLVAFVLIELYVVSSWGAWNQASAYGIRMLITSFPALSIGLARVTQRGIEKFSKKLVWLFLALFILLNFFMIIRFHLYIKEPSFIDGHMTRTMAIERINKQFHTHFRLPEIK